MTLADQLRQKQQEMQITTQELADLLGVSRQSVSHYLNGHRLPGDEVMTRIRTILCDDSYTESRRKIERVLLRLAELAGTLTQEDREQIFSLLKEGEKEDV